MKSIKVFYNGFKVNGEKELIKASFSIEKDSSGHEYAYIYARDYDNLPRGFFEVVNETDSMTDYFDTDHAKIDSGHPLFKYIKYNALKSDYMYYKRLLKNWKENYYHHFTKEEYEHKVSEFEALEDVGHPTEEDIRAIDEMWERRRIAKEEAERKEEEAREANAFIEELETEVAVHGISDMYPIVNGEPTVKIEWSERNGIEDGSVWSLKAANRIFEILDTRQHENEHGGYEKTKFLIEYFHNGEKRTYEGRYDIGDGEGELLNHIYNFGEWYRTHDQFGHELQQPLETNEVLEIWKILKTMVA